MIQSPVRAILWVLISLNGFGHMQAYPTRDSLWKTWYSPSLPDSVRLTALYKLSFSEYFETQPDSAALLANWLLEESNALGYAKGQAQAWMVLGLHEQQSGRADSAEVWGKRSLDLFLSVGDYNDLPQVYNLLAVIHSERSDYLESIGYFRKGIALLNTPKGRKLKARMLGNLGNLFKALGDYPLSKAYYAQSLALKESLGDSVGAAITHINLGVILEETREYPGALENYQSSLATFSRLNFPVGVVSSQNGLGSIFLAMGQFEKALDYANQSLKLSEALSYSEGNMFNHLLFARIYAEQMRYEESLSSGQKALSQARISGNSEVIRDATKVLYEVYKQLGRPAEALEAQTLYIAMRDSLSNEAVQRQLLRQEFEQQAVLDSTQAAQALELSEARLSAEQNLRELQNRFFLLALTLTGLFGTFIWNRFRITRRQNGIISDQKAQVDLALRQVDEQNQKLELAYQQLASKNREVMDSIRYARRIQQALLPPPDRLQSIFPTHFIYYQPKAVVSGDFYWVRQYKDTVWLAVADCTGHGVPGAMIGGICHSGLSQAFEEMPTAEPGRILDRTRELVLSEFEVASTGLSDGMDIVLCRIQGDSLAFAGAYRPLWIVRASNEVHQLSGQRMKVTQGEKCQLIEFSGDRQSIGKEHTTRLFSTQTFTLEAGDTLYLFTDGYQDQFHQDTGKKFLPRRLRELIFQLNGYSLDDQQKMLAETFSTWKGETEQVDDVCVLGVRV
ncbi:MAG TPA: hypothetical protein DCE41_15120 [Cytophagales bacterium]|nr:hypothetical protein [Cytophagales bacterium]HAA18491.1 hypothetical protein [Cytophagales bacterium]HAP61962.1 hypothetical protein [Cytophagales bacterium]